MVDTCRQPPWLAHASANVTAASLRKLKCPLSPLPAGISQAALGEGPAKGSMPQSTMLQLGKHISHQETKEQNDHNFKKRKSI